MRLQRDSYAPKKCAFDAANVQFLRAHLCKSHPVLQQQDGLERVEVPSEPFYQTCVKVGLLTSEPIIRSSSRHSRTAVPCEWRGLCLSIPGLAVRPKSCRER